MPTIDDLQFDTTQWRQLSAHDFEVVWRTPEGDRVDLSLYTGVPDVPASPRDIDALRGFYRDIVTHDRGGLIAAESIELAGLPALRLEAKFPISPTTRGLKHLGTLTLFFADCCFVVRTESVETKLIGIRESSIFTEFRRSLGADASVPMNEWAKDPYDPEWGGPLLRNQSDDVRWDDQFPQHPLTKVRRTLDHVARTVSLSPALRNHPLYEK